MEKDQAKLTITLSANDLVVAQTDNPILWQQVLAAIQQITITPTNTSPTIPTQPGNQDMLLNQSSDSKLLKFAQDIDISVEELQAALSPTLEPPYLDLDYRCWEAMKNGTPKKGLGAISDIGMVGTLLALWFKSAGDLGLPTQAHAQAILEKNNSKKDPNPTRGIKSTKWLSPKRGGTITLNSSQISRAIQVTKSFCTKQWKKPSE